MYHKYLSILMFTFIFDACIAQVDTVAYWNGMIHTELDESIETRSLDISGITPAGAFVLRNLTFDSTQNVVCFYPLLLMGVDQIDFYLELQLTNQMIAGRSYTISLDLGLYDPSGYYPDTLRIWWEPSKFVPKKYDYQSSFIKLDNLCDHLPHRFSTEVVLKENAISLILGSKPKEFVMKSRKTRKMNFGVEDVHSNIHFCHAPISFENIPAGNNDLIYIKRLLITND